jgi:hypothetical protein
MPAVSIELLANLAEIIGASTILTGLVFGLVQLRHYRIQQRDSIAQGLTQTFYNRDLASAIALLQNVPDGITLADLRARGHAYEEAAVTVTTSFETMGILVFKRIASLDIVVDMAGGIVTTMCRKLARCQEELRAELDQPSWGEWFQWLGDQVAREKDSRAPAHIEYRDWRP